MNERYEPTREDILIGRVTDGEAGPADWSELEAVAEQDAGVWQRLARAQRAHARLSHSVEDVIAVAELINLPPREPGVVLRRMRQYAGWAIAAVVALAWLGSHNGVITVGQPGTNVAGLDSRLMPIASSPEAAWDQYITAGTADGRVLGEMPALLVEVRQPQSPGSELREVIFIRQILERKQVRDPQVVEYMTDERGQRVPHLKPARNRTATNPM